MMPRTLAWLIVSVAVIAAVVGTVNLLLQSQHDAVFRGSDAEWILERAKPKPTPGEDLFNNVTRPLLLAGAGVAVVWAIVSLASAKPSGHTP